MFYFYIATIVKLFSFTIFIHIHIYNSVRPVKDNVPRTQPNQPGGAATVARGHAKSHCELSKDTGG